MTRCPKCRAVGRFTLHGSYLRHAVYFQGLEAVCELVKIKRVRCLSCKSTHGVMPGDLVPYRLLSLFVVMFILISIIIRETPVLKIAKAWDFSFQFLYSVLSAFHIHINIIHQYFMETAPMSGPLTPGAASVLSLVREPYIIFQAGYTKLNHRPCFMCKFHNKGGAPPIGGLTSKLPPGGQQHHL